MEELLLSHPTRRYKAGLVIKIHGTKSFILSGKKEIPDGRTAGKVIAHLHFKDTEKTGQEIHLIEECRCYSAFSQVQYPQLLQGTAN